MGFPGCFFSHIFSDCEYTPIGFLCASAAARQLRSTLARKSYLFQIVSLSLRINSCRSADRVRHLLGHENPTARTLVGHADSFCLPGAGTATAGKGDSHA